MGVNDDQLTGEHRLGDGIQLILMGVFMVVWILDSFVLGFSTFLADSVPWIIRIPIGIILLILTFFLERSGLNAVFGGHTHDGVPQPLKVKNVAGNECLVTNAGSNGKFLGVMDMDIQDGEIKSMQYNMLPIITE